MTWLYFRVSPPNSATSCKAVQQHHDVCAALLRPLCPTRVLCGGPALKCILRNFDCILDALQEYADSATAESVARAQGFAKLIGHGNFLISLKCAVAVLEYLETLNRAVQTSSKSVASMVTAMKMTVGALNDLRDEDRFQALFEEAVMLCRKSDVPFPEFPRQRRQPKRLCGPAPANTWTTPEEYFRNQFFLVVDTAVTQLKLRYDQTGLHTYMQLEKILTATDTKTMN